MGQKDKKKWNNYEVMIGRESNGGKQENQKKEYALFMYRN